MRAASAALLAAAVFFAGVLVGGRGVADEAEPPTPVVLAAAGLGTPEPPATESPLEVVEVPRQVEEDSIDDYRDTDDIDSSGPGSGDDDGDNSGPGSDDSGSDDSGSDSDSGSGSSGSGSDSSGSGSSGSDSSGSGSSGSGS